MAGIGKTSLDELNGKAKDFGIPLWETIATITDRSYVVYKGQVLCHGTPKEVLSAPLLRDVFGVEALIDEHPLHGYPRITWITQP